VPGIDRRDLALAFVSTRRGAARVATWWGDVVVATRDRPVAELVVDRGAQAVFRQGTGGLNGDLGWTLAA
jgi:hypothetical protein